MNDRSCEPYNAKDVTALIEQNDCVKVELEEVKQHYKELYDSIKITRAHTSENTSTMLNEIESLKAQLRSKVSCFTSDSVKPKVLAPGMYAIDVKPIPHPLKNNRSAHLNYISHLKRTRRLMETIHVTFDEMDQKMVLVRNHEFRPEAFHHGPLGQLKSGLAPTDKELEMLFQPMFDKYLKQSQVSEPVPSATKINAQVVPPGISLSTTIAQDAPSTSASSSTSDMHHPVRHQEIAEEPTLKTPQSITMFYILHFLHITLVMEIQNTMAEQNVPSQAPARTDEQIISVDILRNTNFFRAFSASASVTSVYIQQFWNSMKYDKKTGVYSCQVDEQWFNLSADLLRKALDITPVDPAHPFELPPTGDTVIDFVNQLGYPEHVEFVSNIRVNYVYQPND
ncbi:hypothetical protein Tco_0740331 [Tanacetum coccineum]